MEVHSLGGEDCNVKGGLPWEGWIAVGGEDCNVRGGGRDCDRRPCVGLYFGTRIRSPVNLGEGWTCIHE